MTFLNPAILFGLVAASIPVLIHLLNLRKLKKVEFSTLAFLQELQKTKIRRIKLKQWILLAIRILIIVLLVTAFARPAIKNLSLAGKSSTAKTSAVIILDNSFSMSLVSERGSYFNLAKSAAKSILENFQPGDDVTLILTSDLSHNFTKHSTNLSLVQKEIDESSISDYSGKLNDAIIKASEILNESKNFNKEIYVLSDLQKSNLYETKNQIQKKNITFDPKIRLYYFEFPKKEIINLAITDFTVNNQIFQKGSVISFTATITNYSNQPVNNTIASLYLNGNRQAQQAISLKSNETQKVTFETTLQQTGLVEAEVQLEDDDILNDNKRCLTIWVPDKINVLLVFSKQDDARFLKLALSTIENIEITERKGQQLNFSDYRNYDAVFIIGSENISSDSRIESFLQMGGGAVIFPSSDNSLENFKLLCSKLNIGVPTNAVGSLNYFESPTFFDKIDFEHPILSELFQNKQKRQINSPEIYYYFKINSLGKGYPIISLMDNSPFLSEYKFGNGKLLLFNSAPVLSWNNFPLKALFSPLIAKIVFYLSSNSNTKKETLAGQPLIVDLSKNIFPQIRVMRPNNSAEIINLDTLRNKSFFQYNKTDIDGIYKFYSKNKLIDYAAVNFNPAESINSYLNDSDFKEYLKEIKFGGSVFSLSIDGDFLKSIIQSRFGAELWKYFLMGALILALIEMLVSKSSKEDLVEV
ncbi:BatA domain-containing protein [Melioribacteraceae bacterium 4301-Me]|uniref:BatA domain-containing protein n=1 Tax=Pyranulibacter aquaticus TaxID=3163344 RepID=UPI00359AC9AE